jgi:uncharacterized protein YndB with AHSA1/START domain
MPKPYKLEVKQTINAPIAKVFGILNDLNQFKHWNPFLAMDPNTQYTVSDPAGGVGATYNYESKKLGKGDMLITGVYDNSVIMLDMNFTSPNNDTAKVEWRVTREGEGTEFTWTMTGQRNLGMRIMVKVLGMDKMMTKHFQDGMRRLKTYAEKS